MRYFGFNLVECYVVFANFSYYFCLGTILLLHSEVVV